MQKDDGYIVFILDLKTNIIKNTNLISYLNSSFSKFFDYVLANKQTFDFIEPYNKDILLNEIKATKYNILYFHVKDSPIVYQFTISQFDENSTLVTITHHTEILNEKYYSKLDYLTGIYARSYLNYTIEEKIKTSKDMQCCLFIIDLNNFKKVNDALGHRVGDDALRGFSQNLKRLAGNGNIIGRYGGDEFILFTIGKTLEELKDICHEILKTSYTFEINGKTYSTTCCCGGTITDTNFTSFEYLVERADKALYRAKNANKMNAYIDDYLIYGEKQKVIKSNNKDHFKLFYQELEFKNRFSLLTSTLTLFLLLIITIFTENKFQSNLQKNAYNEASSTISMISEQIEATISSNISSWFNQLNICEKMLGNIDSINNNVDQVDSILSSVNNQISFDNVALLLRSGTLYMNKDTTYNISTEKIAEEIIINRNNYIDNIYFYYSGNGIVFGTPFEGKGLSEQKTSDSIAGICGLISISNFSEFLNTTAFENKTVVTITRNDGFSVASSLNIEESAKKNNFIELMKNKFNDAEYNSIVDDYYNNQTRAITYQSVVDGVEQNVMAFFSPISFNNFKSDWHIIVFVPNNYIIKNINSIFNQIIILVMSLLIFLSVLILSIIIAFNKIRIKLDLNKYIDPSINGINLSRFEIDGTHLVKTSNNYAVICFNIVKFKFLSEQFDRETINLLLKNIYQFILSNINDRELASRIFEDRFIVLMEDNINDIQKRVDDIRIGIQNIITEQYSYSANVIAGVYAPNRKIEDFNLAISKAKIALQNIGGDYILKSVSYYDETMLRNELDDNDLERKAKMALNNHDFIVYYQGKRNIQQNKWSSCEALVRWNDSKGQGLISPGKFIPLFEKNGFIINLDLYVFEQVCIDLRQMLDKNEDPIRVSVNVSRKNLFIPNFISRYEKIIKQYNIPPHLLEFELTESMAMDNEIALKEAIIAIHNLGCYCSIDDFGSGYSSLGMLTKFDFDVIKLDRSFFTNTAANSERVIESVINLAKSLGKDVVAEGIEDKKQVDFLTKIKCDEIQGFYFCKPMPIDEFKVMVKK